MVDYEIFAMFTTYKIDKNFIKRHRINMNINKLMYITYINLQKLKSEIM